jgi:hypothetical protein
MPSAPTGQLSDRVSNSGLTHEHYQLNRSERPYMKESMLEWGFMLSDAYNSQPEHRPSLTALKVMVSESGILEYLGADFDLRDLPVTSALHALQRIPRQGRHLLVQRSRVAGHGRYAG